MVHLLLAVIYLSFISLGLPDSLLGSAWPSMYQGFHVPLSYSGIIFFIISAGTVVSSLQSDRLTRKLGAGKVTAISVAMTAVALFGFSISTEFWQLGLWAIPYGLGAGSVDAALNNYVALHFASRHMSWLHCMWGVGASVGPYIMGFALTIFHSWNLGYRIISILQLILTVIILFSLPLWKSSPSGSENDTASSSKPLSLKQILAVPGVKAVMISFFCYCAIEQTAGLWASSYLVIQKNIAPDVAATLASLFFIGITIGRALGGFLTFKLNDTQMIRLGQVLTLCGLVLIILPLNDAATLAGLVLTGLGCAPIYPSIIHSTPAHFGAERSQAIIGVEMASAYIGNCVMPPLFGWLQSKLSIALFPWFLLVILVVMVCMLELVERKTRPEAAGQMA